MTAIMYDDEIGPSGIFEQASTWDAFAIRYKVFEEFSVIDLGTKGSCDSPIFMPGEMDILKWALFQFNSSFLCQRECVVACPC